MPTCPARLERTEAFGAEILELSVALGGTITGEHGVGFEKLGGMCVQFAADELAAFHRVKAAFDPQGLLNPGKAVPSLHRCAEFGRMHVHHGELKFPGHRAFLMSDRRAFAERIRAASREQPLCIRGGGSKDFYGGTLAGEVLDTRESRGIVAYEPTELVITARCGTPLAEIEAALAEQRPVPGLRAAVLRWRGHRSAVSSPPASPDRAAPRSARCATSCSASQLMDGEARRADFRRPGDEERRRLRCLAPDRRQPGHARPDPRSLAQGAAAAAWPKRRCASTCRRPRRSRRSTPGPAQPLPISASCWCDDVLTVRLSGASAAVDAATGSSAARSRCRRSRAFWSDLREQRHAFFAGAKRLWRLSLPSIAPPRRPAAARS